MFYKKLFIILTAVVLLITNNCSFAIEEADEHELFHRSVELKNGSTLDLADCVALAFKNSPKIRKKKYELDLAKANVGIAKSQYFPVISAGIGFYNENNSNSIYYNTHYRELPSIGASINQLVWNFGKSSALIKMEKFYQIGAEYEFMDSICATLFDVKAKYYNVLKAKALMDVAEFNIKMNEDFVDISKKKKKFELLTAELNLNDAQVKYYEAQNEYRNAILDLSNAMFIETQPDYTIKDTKTFYFGNDVFTNPYKWQDKLFIPENLGFDLNKAVDIAYENSPDLKVLIAIKNAMGEQVKYIKRTYFPDLTADVGYGFSKFNEEHSSNDSLKVGVNLTSSVNLMALKNEIKHAQAEVNIAEDEIEHFKKDLFFEVKRAINNIDKSKRQIETSQLVIDNGLDNLKVIQEQYVANKVDYTSLQDSRKDYITSLNNYINSIYGYNMSLIQLEMAMHEHITDIHHKSDHAIHYHFKELIDDLDKALDCDEKDVKKTKSKKKNDRI